MRALFGPPFLSICVQACPSGGTPTTRKVVPPPFGLGLILPSATSPRPQFGQLSPVLTPVGLTRPIRRGAEVREKHIAARGERRPPAGRALVPGGAAPGPLRVVDRSCEAHRPV